MNKEIIALCLGAARDAVLNSEELHSIGYFDICHPRVVQEIMVHAPWLIKGSAVSDSTSHNYYAFSNVTDVEIRDTLWDFASNEHMAIAYCMAATILRDPETPRMEALWALGIIERFEFDLDGYIKRYPDEGTYQEAVLILKNFIGPTP